MRKYIILIFMTMSAVALWSQTLEDQNAAGALSPKAEESRGRNSRIYGEMEEASSTPQVGGVTVSGTLDFTLGNTFTISDANDPVKESDGLPGYIADVNDAIFNISSYVSDWSQVTLGVSGANLTSTTASSTPINLDSFTLDSFVLREFGLLADQASNPLSLLLSTGYRDFGVQGYSGGGTESGGAEVNTAELPKGILFRATPAYLLGQGDFIALDMAAYSDWRGAQADDADFSTINVGRDQYSGPLVLANLYGGVFGFSIEAYYATRNTLGTNDGDYLVRSGATTSTNNISPKNVMGFGLNGEVAPNWTVTLGYDFIPPINDKTATVVLSNTASIDSEKKTGDGTAVGAPTTEKSSPLGKFGSQSIGVGTGYTQTLSSGTGFMKNDIYWRAGLSGNIDIGIDDGTVLAGTSPYTYNTKDELGVVYNPLTVELSGRYMHGAFGIAGGYKVSDFEKALKAKDLSPKPNKEDYTFGDFAGFEVALVAEVQGFTIFTGWVSSGGDINADINPGTDVTPYGQKGSAVTDKDGNPPAGAIFFRLITSF